MVALATYILEHLIENLIVIALITAGLVALVRRRWLLGALPLAIISASTFGNLTAGSISTEQFIWLVISLIIAGAIAYLTKPSKRTE
jgi:uncharacterized membrane protein